MFFFPLQLFSNVDGIDRGFAYPTPRRGSSAILSVKKKKKGPPEFDLLIMNKTAPKRGGCASTHRHITQNGLPLPP